jgi:hypothetical protein
MLGEPPRELPAAAGPAPAAAARDPAAAGTMHRSGGRRSAREEGGPGGGRSGGRRSDGEEGGPGGGRPGGGRPGKRAAGDVTGGAVQEP